MDCHREIEIADHLAVFVAKRFRAWDLLDDIKAIGYVIAWQYGQTYDPSKKASLLTWLYIPVLQRMVRYVRQVYQYNEKICTLIEEKAGFYKIKLPTLDEVEDRVMWEYYLACGEKQYGKRWRQVVELMDAGYTIKEVAQKIGVHRSQIDFVLTKCRKLIEADMLHWGEYGLR